MNPIKSVPVVRLSNFYFFYFATLGAFVPLWPVYLEREIGFSALQIGELMAIFMSSKIISPLIIGWLVDHYGRRLETIRWVSLLSIICFAGIFIESSFIWIAMIMFSFGFFWNASLPQFEAITLNYLHDNTDRYSSIRLWGSIGFIVTVIGTPLLLVWFGFEWFTIIMLLLLISISASTYLVKDKISSSYSTSTPKASLQSVLKQPIIIALLLACVLQQASHGAYYTFFSLYLYEHHYSPDFTGAMWALGVIAEVALFLLVQPLMQRFHAYLLFSFSVLITAIRWLLLAYGVDNTAVLIFSQLLHAISYGLFHASAIQIVHQYFPNSLQGRGQALYAGLSFGVGGVIGSYSSGYLWETVGKTDTFIIAASMAFLGWLISLLLFRYRSTSK